MKSKKEVEALLEQYKKEYAQSGHIVHERDIEILEWVLM